MKHSPIVKRQSSLRKAERGIGKFELDSPGMSPTGKSPNGKVNNFGTPDLNNSVRAEEDKLSIEKGKSTFYGSKGKAWRNSKSR